MFDMLETMREEQENLDRELAEKEEERARFQMFSKEIIHILQVGGENWTAAWQEGDLGDDAGYAAQAGDSFGGGGESLEAGVERV